jgi:hypothetical protein
MGRAIGIGWVCFAKVRPGGTCVHRQTEASSVCHGMCFQGCLFIPRRDDAPASTATAYDTYEPCESSISKPSCLAILSVLLSFSVPCSITLTPRASSLSDGHHGKKIFPHATCHHHHPPPGQARERASPAQRLARSPPHRARATWPTGPVASSLCGAASSCRFFLFFFLYWASIGEPLTLLFC